VIARLAQEGIRGDSIRNSNGNNLLHSACEVGNLSLVYSLVEMYDAHQFSTFNQEGLQPLHVACRHNSQFIVTFLVKNKIVTGTELTEDGDSPLHIASQYNATDVVKYLLDIVPSNLLWTANKKGPLPSPSLS
jgi:ankyrin repeat protein